MGASAAAFWDDDSNAWANPALLGYLHGIHYTYANAMLVTNLSNVSLRAERISLGISGIGFAFGGLPSDRLGRTFLDNGWSRGPIGPQITGFDDIDSWAAGVNLVELSEFIRWPERERPMSRLVDLSLGYTTKRVRVLERSFPSGDPVLVARAKANDRGLLLRLTPRDSTRPDATDNASSPLLGGWRFDLSYAHSQQNDRDAVWSQPNHFPIPLERATRDGFGLRLASGAWSRFDETLNVHHLGWLVPGFAPWISWSAAWDRSRFREKARPTRALLDEFGCELSLGHLLAIRGGHRHQNGSTDWWTFGWSIGLQYRNIAGFHFDGAERSDGLASHGFSASFHPLSLASALSGE